MGDFGGLGERWAGAAEGAVLGRGGQSRGWVGKGGLVGWKWRFWWGGVLVAGGEKGVCGGWKRGCVLGVVIQD